MRRALAGLALGAGWLGAALLAFPQSSGTDARFAALDIHIETAEPLAAWQFELRAASGPMRVVGVENGDSAAFGDAPYYDLAPVAGGRADRIVVADYSLHPAAELPVGGSRVATVHVYFEGPAAPDYVLSLMAAGGVDGEPIRASIDFEIP